MTMLSNGDYDLLKKRVSQKYSIRELPGCFVIEGAKGSVVVYRTKEGKKICVCFQEKREYGIGKEVDDIIDSYCK